MVEEGRSAKFECDSVAKPPFYYYMYNAKNIHPPKNLIKEREQWPWSVYAINASSSPSNLWVIPTSLAKSDQPLKIPNITVDFHNALICCQGFQSGKWLGNTTVLSVIRCYRVNVQCK